jgi:hypothetical protein
MARLEGVVAFGLVGAVIAFPFGVVDGVLDTPI